MVAYFLCIIALIVASSGIGCYQDTSESMENTLMAGDMCFVVECWYGFRMPLSDRVLIPGAKPRVNEVIVFDSPLSTRETMVKRIVAVGGQTVAMEAKRLLVDGITPPLPPGAKNTDPIIFPPGEGLNAGRDNHTVETLPDTAVFVMGDNRDYSFDSRSWGILPVRNLRGRVFCILWSTDPSKPWSDITHKFRMDRFFRRVS